MSEPASRADPAPHSAAAPGAHSPRLVALDAALRSAEPRVETMARVLDLLTMLVPSNVALFYAVNDRMEKYATNPIVAKVEHSRLPELNHARASTATAMRRMTRSLRAGSPTAPPAWRPPTISVARSSSTAPGTPASSPPSFR